MRAFLLFAFLAASLAVVIGCADDIILTPPAPLTGKYNGTYTVKTDYGSGPSEVTYFDYILWEFEEVEYHAETDSSLHDSTGACFSAVDGIYSYDEGVRMQQKTSYPSPGCFTIKPEFEPNGTFRLETQSDGSILLKQSEGTTYKEIHLTRVKDTTSGG